MNLLGSALSSLLVRPLTAVLLVVLVIAAVIDVRSYRIPNLLSASAAVLGLALHVWDSGAGWRALGSGLAGMATVLVLLIPLHALRILGAGDVKLLAAVGAFLGFPHILLAMLLVFATGGAVAVGAALLRRAGRHTLDNLGFIARAAVFGGTGGLRLATQSMVSGGRIPYAVCIALGTAGFLVLRETGF